MTKSHVLHAMPYNFHKGVVDTVGQPLVNVTACKYNREVGKNKNWKSSRNQSMVEKRGLVVSRVSSNKLFHYTKSIDVIKSILENGFFPRCPVEDISFILTEIEKEKAKSAIPMVCFCDLPKELQNEHKSKYGNYGISMNKEWGMSRGGSPVMYIPEGSQSIGFYNHALVNCKGIIENGTNVVEYTEELYGSMLDFTGFMKTYSDGENIFYDEREWRYLVSFYDANNPRNRCGREVNRLIGDDITKEGLDALNRAMENEYPLHFQISDVDAIILPSRSDKEEMKRYIDGSSLEKNLGNGRKLNTEEKEDLKRKIQVIV